jgi:hypothetical protein
MGWIPRRELLNWYRAAGEPNPVDFSAFGFVAADANVFDGAGVANGEVEWR